jgi:predicted phosphodiesterase
MRILLVADVHANLAAFRAVLAAAEAATDALYCLGDLVGYGPDPAECVELAAEKATLAVAGNHDLAAVGRLGMEAFAGHARRALEYTRGRLSAAARAFLETLPLRLDPEGLCLTHGSPADPVWTYVISADDAADAFAASAAPLILVGHSHLPSVFAAPQERRPGARAISAGYAPAGLSVDLAPGRLILNPGSVGYPRDAADAHRPESSGRAVARYAVLDTAAARCEFRSAVYDRSETARRERLAGL